MSRWMQDVRYALRQLYLSSLFTLMAVLTMALGISTTTTAMYLGAGRGHILLSVLTRRVALMMIDLGVEMAGSVALRRIVVSVLTEIRNSPNENLGRVLASGAIELGYAHCRLANVAVGFN